MNYEIVKIAIIFSIITFVNYIRPCPTELGYKLIAANKISYKDLKNLNSCSFDFKTKSKQ
jgi:hypothetical protein